MRGLDEMRYEFTQPFIVDSTKAWTRLAVEPTPIGGNCLNGRLVPHPNALTNASSNFWQRSGSSQPYCGRADSF